MPSTISASQFDFKNAVTTNRLAGLLRMMAGYKLHYTGAIMALAVAAISRTATFLLLRHFVDNVIGQPDFGQQLTLIVIGFLGLALLEGGFTYFSGRMAAYTAENITRRLRDYLFDHLQRLTFTYHDKMQTGELIQRCTSDVDAVRRFYAEEAIGVGRILLLFLINFITLLTLNWQLGLLSVAVVPVVTWVSLYFFRKISDIYEEYQNQDAKLSTVLQENLTGVRVVKAFARQDYERDKFENENSELFRRGRKLLVMHSLYWPLTDVITGAQMIVGYLAGALMALNGTISVGTYLAYVGIIIWIIQPMRGLGRLIVQASTGLVSYQRLMEIVREDREILTDARVALPSDVRGEIVFENVGFEYEPGMPVLRDINFHLKAGQSVALIGSTGSGKTSLVNLLPRFYEYTTGRITLDGINIKDIAKEDLRRVIGIVEQEPFLFSRTIRENITYGVGYAVSDGDVEAAARAAAIHDVILTFPEGYQTLVGEKGVTLSGGQKQRVAIARILLKNPCILILDDATSSVDTETEASIREALQGLMQNRTTFIIAHRVQSVMNADLILVLDKGRIVQRGTHEQLMMQPGIYREICHLQAQIEEELERELANV
jgi:ATP-binding cassette, subfamily B, bacterial